jgi:hypothetical protein
MSEEITLEIIGERLKNLIDENAKEHASILAQTTKTNGTVKDLVKWKWLLIGGGVILNIIVLPVVISVVIQFLIKALKLQ